jgi:hypothetical protein
MISAVCLARSRDTPCCAVGPWTGEWQERRDEAEIGGKDVELECRISAVAPIRDDRVRKGLDWELWKTF